MRRACHLILILLLLIGQVHACVTSWQLPGGKACVECPRLISAPAAAKKALTAARDCRDCCKFLGCSHDSKGKAQASDSGAQQIVFARIEPELILPLASPAPAPAVFIGIESFVANAPPSQTQSRAPPSPLM